MQKVRIDKAKLIELLRKNRDEHRDVFVKAQEGYRAKVIELLDQQLTRARNGGNVGMAVFTRIVEPEDHTDDYDRILEMLEMSVDRTVELTQQEFKNFAQDDWNWSQSWARSNSSYTSSAKFSKYTQ